MSKPLPADPLAALTPALESYEERQAMRHMLKDVLRIVAEREARERQIALLWAQPLMTNEWEKVQ
jgi:hypothetical protein